MHPRYTQMEHCMQIELFSNFIHYVSDIKSWFQRSKSFTIETASSADIQMLEKAIDTELPQILKLLLREMNGSLWFLEKEAMTTKKIQAVVSKLEGSWRN